MASLRADAARFTISTECDTAISGSRLPRSEALRIEATSEPSRSVPAPVADDDVLRDVYVRGKYRDGILPMTVLRRLDAVLEPTKQKVLEMKAALDRERITNQDDALRAASGQAFYNTSPFLLRDLKSRATQ